MPTKSRFRRLPPVLPILIACCLAASAGRLEAAEGRIEGHVRSAENSAPIETTVRIFDAVGSYVFETHSTGGNYAFTGLAAGDYYLMTLGKDVWAGILYPGVPCQGTWYNRAITCARALGSPVTLAAGQTLTGVDLEMPRGSTVSGRVTDAATGLPIAGAEIRAWFPYFWEHLWVANTDADGRYTIAGLADTSLRLYTGSAGYSSQFYRQVNCVHGSDGSCRDLGQPISVVFGQNPAGIDFALVKPGALSGRVVDAATGAPVWGARVEVKRAANQEMLGGGETEQDGTFLIGGLPPADVVVHAARFDHALSYHGGSTPKIVTIRSERTATGIDIALVKAGGIAGRVVTAAGGTAVPACRVDLVRVGDSQPSAAAGCQQDGSFEFSGLAPGSYRLVASSDDGSQHLAHHLYGYGSCNWKDVANLCVNLEDGTPIEVRAGETAGPFELPLEAAAELRATVNFALAPGGPAPAGHIRIFDHEGLELRNVGLSQATENHSFFLAPGSYRLTVEGDPIWQSFAWGNVPCGRWFCDPEDGAAIELEAGETASGSFDLQPIAPYAGCEAGSTHLCLNQGRFLVRAIWGDYLGNSGSGIATQVTPDTGYFHFFTPNNVEVLVKALDGCDARLGHHFWFFAGGLTDVQVELRVFDTVTGDYRLYTNTRGTTFDPILDIDAFDTCDAEEPEPALGAAPAAAPRPALQPGLQIAGQPATYCELSPYPRTCVAGGRFAVRTFYGPRGGSRAEGQARLLTGDTVAFYFFDPKNYEVMVKVLDACSQPSPGYWVFAAGLTDVEVDIVVEDLATGRSKIYQRGPGPFSPLVDLGSFPCE